METEGWVRQLTMDIQGQKLSIPIYLLPVSRAKIIIYNFYVDLKAHFDRLLYLKLGDT